MSFIQLTGCQIAAGRAMAGLSRQELAERARLSYYTIRGWELSSHSAPEATYSHLCRAVGVLEAAGVVFTDGGVQLLRPVPMAGSTIIHSASGAAA